MKCTDKSGKKFRRRRILIGCMISTLILLCACLAGIIYYDYYYDKNLSYVSEYANTKYNQPYYKDSLFASNFCVVGKEENKKHSKVSELKAYALFDISNAETAYSYKVHNKIYPASTTKILTALIALENSSLSDIVTVSKNASSSSFAWDEQTCEILEGDTLTMEDLLYGLLLYSGNDTAVAIAEHVGGSVKGFAELMNKKAAELYATNSHFMNPSGLYDDNHYTTAYDLYLIFNECIKNEDFVKIISADSYIATVTGSDSKKREIKWEPTNFYAQGIIKSPEHVNVIGGKTGTLQVAGNCLILMSENKDAQPYISIVMGAEDKEYLYKDMTTLLNEIPKTE